MDMDKWTFGLTMMIIGMGGTFLTLWILSLVIDLLKKVFPLAEKASADKKS
jgi:Na+-transporting methylmalonyl-CoA/oxaloacetate decarboxylase gamma subunit